MSDQVSNLRGVLSQTQAVEKSQEKARRKGDVQQQQKARQLLDKVDIQGHQVEETPATEQKKVDPEEKRVERDGEQQTPQEQEQEDAGERQEPPPQRIADDLSEEEGKGRLIDRTA